MKIVEITKPVDENRILLYFKDIPGKVWKWLINPKPKTGRFFTRAGTWLQGLSQVALTAMFFMIPIISQGLSLGIQAVIAVLSNLFNKMVQNGDVSEDEIAEELALAGVPEEDIPEMSRAFKKDIDNQNLQNIFANRARDPEPGELERDVTVLVKKLSQTPATEAISESHSKLIKEYGAMFQMDKLWSAPEGSQQHLLRKSKKKKKSKKK